MLLCGAILSLGNVATFARLQAHWPIACEARAAPRFIIRFVRLLLLLLGSYTGFILYMLFYRVWVWMASCRRHHSRHKRVRHCACWLLGKVLCAIIDWTCQLDSMNVRARKAFEAQQPQHEMSTWKEDELKEVVFLCKCLIVFKCGDAIVFIPSKMESISTALCRAFYIIK